MRGPTKAWLVDIVGWVFFAMIVVGAVVFVFDFAEILIGPGG